jgi:hypothetical protein
MWLSLLICFITVKYLPPKIAFVSILLISAIGVGSIDIKDSKFYTNPSLTIKEIPQK